MFVVTHLQAATHRPHDHFVARLRVLAFITRTQVTSVSTGLARAGSHGCKGEQERKVPSQAIQVGYWFEPGDTGRLLVRVVCVRACGLDFTVPSHLRARSSAESLRSKSRRNANKPPKAERSERSLPCISNASMPPFPHANSPPTRTGATH